MAKIAEMFKSGAKWFKGVVIVSIIVIVLALVLGSQHLVEYVTNSEYVVHQSAVKGKLTIWNSNGYQPQLFGRISHVAKTGDIYLSSDPLDGGTGAEVQAIEVQFPDGKAKIDVVAKYKLSLNQSNQEQLAIECPSEEAIKSMIRQQIIEAVKQTGPLMSSSEAYAEKRSEFSRLAQKQAIDGIYRSEVTYDTTYDADSIPVVEKNYGVMVDSLGSPVISKNGVLHGYGIDFIQFTVKDMEFDSMTVALIDARKEAQKADQDKITAERKGEARIASEKATQEVAKIKEVTIAQKAAEVATIRAQQEKDVAVLNATKKREVATENLQTTKLDAEATIVASKAKEIAIKKSGALTETRKYEIDAEVKKHVEGKEADSKRPVPGIIIGGSGSDNGGSGVDQAVMVGLLKELNMVGTPTK